LCTMYMDRADQKRTIFHNIVTAVYVDVEKHFVQQIV